MGRRKKNVALPTRNYSAEKGRVKGRSTLRYYLAIAQIPSNAKFSPNVIEFPLGTPLKVRDLKLQKGR